MEIPAVEIEQLKNRVAVLEAQNEHWKELWEQVWKAYQVGSKAIAKSEGFGEFRDLEVVPQNK